MRVLGFALVIILASQASAQPLDVDGVLAKVQKFYEETKDFRARFDQESVKLMLGPKAKTTATGSLYFLRPGMVRFDYQRSDGQRQFVLDGKQLWYIDRDSESISVMVCENFQHSDLPTAVAFLFGTGDLRKDFKAAASTEKVGAPGDHVLDLTPVRPEAHFKKLVVVVDPKTFEVKRTVVVDPAGNTNQFTFTELKRNLGALKVGDFAFTPPAGVPVTKIPGCS